MVPTQPMKIPGRWQDGFVLDYHTVSSTYLGEDEYGHAQFETRRSDLGDLLYRLKYRVDASVVTQIVEAASAFVAEWGPEFDVVVPVPPSRERDIQPVFLLAEGIANRVGLAYAPECVTRVRDLPELKNVYSYQQRTRLLAGSHAVDQPRVANKRVLLFDDLYRSGATMNAVAIALYDEGMARDVYALAITRTRSHH